SRWNGCRLAAASQASRIDSRWVRSAKATGARSADVATSLTRESMSGAGRSDVRATPPAAGMSALKWASWDAGMRSGPILAAPSPGSQRTARLACIRNLPSAAGGGRSRTRALQWTDGRPGARARRGTTAAGARGPAPRTAPICTPRRERGPGAAQGGVAAGGPATAPGRCGRSRAGRRRGRRGRAVTRLNASAPGPASVADPAGLHRRLRAHGPAGARLAPGRALARPISSRPARGSMSDPIEPVEISALDRTLLEELEPEVGRLVERHLKVAQEWFPHEYI